jgi:hypothetical protein
MKVKDLFVAVVPQPEPPPPPRAVPAREGTSDIVQADQIIKAWRDILGVQLNPNTVANHLAQLKKWHDNLKRTRCSRTRSE